jgi:hypothetical protein
MGSSTTLMCSSACTYSMPSTRNNAPFKELFSHMSSSTALLARAHLPFSSHQSTRMCARKSFKPEWSSSSGHLCSRASWKTGKNVDLYQNPNQTISFHKSTSPSDFCSRTHWFCVFCCLLQNRNLDGGKGAFLHGLQTLMLLCKAIAFSHL